MVFGAVLHWQSGVCDRLRHTLTQIGALTDLPTHLYLTVLVWKSAGSTDVRWYFSKQEHRVSRKYTNRDMNEWEFITSKADRLVLMELSFVDI